jgi:uncharacterized protein (DUF58 family)
MEFAEVRAYESGDDYRAIDWNVSARMGSPFVKTFVEERELTVLLVVDRSGSEEFGDPSTKAELGAEVAAVLALAAARQNDRVGALVFSGAVDHVVPPRKGRLHALRIIRDLLAFSPRDRRTNVAGALAYAGQLLHHRSIVVVLSDFRAVGWEEPLARLARKHEVVAITVDDPREAELPAAGWLELRDAETGESVLVNSDRSDVRLAVAMAAEAERLARARAFTRARVDHVGLRTDQPYAEVLHRAFAERARRLRR